MDEITELGSPERLSVPIATLLFEGKKGRTIHLDPCGAQLRFTNYGAKDSTFTLPVATVQHPNKETTLTLLPDGKLQYSFGLTAQVPVSATPDKIWCTRCAKRQTCGDHKIPLH
jgi:hypothetical protein